MNLQKGIFIIFLLSVQYFPFAQSPIADNIDAEVYSRFAHLSENQTIDTLFRIASDYLEKESYEEALSLFQEVLIKTEKHQKKRKNLPVLLQIAQVHYRLNNYTIAQKYIKKCIENFDEQTPTEIKGDAYSQLANTYYNLGDYRLTHEYKLKSIEIKELMEDTAGIARDYYDLGSMFFYQSMTEKALEFYNKAMVLGNQIGSARIVYNCTAALGATFERVGNRDTSLALNLRSLEIADSLEYATGQAYALHNIGSNYLEFGEYEKAIFYMQNSLQIKMELGDNWGFIGSKLGLAEVYIRTGKFDLAEQCLKEALAVAEKLKSKGRIAEVYMNLALLYQESNQKDSTIRYLANYVELKDSIMNESIAREMGDRKSQFEIQRKEYEISLLKKDNQLLESEKTVQRLNSLMAIALSAFLLFLSGVFWILLIRQRKLATTLKEKNKEIEQQKEQIQIQNKLLESSNEDLKQFAYVASHDLREPLRMIKSYGTLISRRYKELLDQSGREFLHFMTDAAGRMDKLLLDLLSYSRTSRDERPFEEVSVSELLNTVRVLNMGLIKEKNARLDFNPEKMPVVLGRKTQLHQLFQNLITNGIKYNRQNQPHIIIDCEKNCENHIFSVKDNGIGLEEKNREKIFEMFSRLHSKEEFEGSGIGLATCKKIVQMHKGDIWVESEPGKGSTFFFSLPFYENESDEFLKKEPHKAIMSSGVV